MISIKLKKEKISNRELTFIIIGFTIGSSFILPPGSAVGNKAWLAILIGLIEGLLIAGIYTALPLKIKKKNLLEILTQVFGKIIGKILFLLFILYCFHLGSLVVRNFMDFITITMMPTTPIIAIGITFLSVCIYATYNGIGVIARNSLILVPLTVVAVAITVVLLFKDMKIINFKPFFEVPLKDLLIASHSAASFPFGETSVFLLVFPFVNGSKKIRKSVAKGIIFGAFMIIVVVVRNVAVLGIRSTVATYPSAQAVRLINVANVITRLEVIIFFNLITMGFIKTSVLLWGSSIGFGQLINIKSPDTLVIPVALLMLFVATYQFENVMQNFKLIKVYPLYVPFFQVGIPVLTLIVAKIRKII